MKRIIVVLLAILPLQSRSQINFDTYFTDKVLRFDFMFAGNSSTTVVYPVGMKEEPFYGGSKTNLLDKFNFGNFKYEVFDFSNNKLIYSKGFCSLYQEWQTTAEAKIMQRSFYEVATMPFPKNKIRFVLSMRERNGSFTELYSTVIDPGDYFIRKEKPVSATVTKIIDGGNPANAIDLVFLAEGYTASEMAKFRSDVKRLAENLFKEKPFDEFRDSISIWAVESISSESGTDIPGERFYVNTVMNSSFFTFDLDRYLTTTDIKSVNDYAGLVPHDNIIVLINSKKYGGGGVYNYYSGTTSDNSLSAKVCIHEFGHGFAGLADEYYSSTVAYEEFYPLNVEPWEANITTRVNFDAKWKNLIDKSTPVPTPAEERYRNVTGLFEGAGYSAKGIYRSGLDCRMKGNTADSFCNVCINTIRKVARSYLK